MGIFAKLFGKSRKQASYQDDWQSYLLNKNETISSTIVDLNFGQKTVVAPQENLVYLSVELCEPQENGMANKEEETELWKIEDDLMLAFYKNDINLSFAGQITTKNSRTFYFYTDNILLTEKTISAVLLKYPKYVHELGHKMDSRKQTYFDLLYPPPRQMQQIKNRKVLNVLTENKDDLSKERAVTHWIYFGNMADLEKYEVFGENLGFETLVKEKEAAENEDYTYKLVISRIDKVSHDVIDGYTLELWEKANELNGTYDGWETSVEK